MRYYPELDEIYDIDRQLELDEAMEELRKEELHSLRKELIAAIRKTEGEELNEEDVMNLSDDDLILAYRDWFPSSEK